MCKVKTFLSLLLSLLSLTAFSNDLRPREVLIHKSHVSNLADCIRRFFEEKRLVQTWYYVSENPKDDRKYKKPLDTNILGWVLGGTPRVEIREGVTTSGCPGNYKSLSVGESDRRQAKCLMTEAVLHCLENSK